MTDLKAGNRRFLLDLMVWVPDALIGAAAAIFRDALLITNDSHFANIKSLALQGC